MRVAVFDTHSFERKTIELANQRYTHKITFFEPRLSSETAILAQGFDAVCSFVNDRLDAKALAILAAGGVKLIALRSAGYNHVDLQSARQQRLTVLRVPEYSPFAVAEHALALMMSLNRKIHKAYNRTRELNFTLDGLVGFDMQGKTVGVVGTGRIGCTLVRILHGFGCKILAYDRECNEEIVTRYGVEYVSMERIFQEVHILSLHVPLTPETFHMVNEDAITQMRRGVMIINTGRGGLIDSRALIEGLKKGHVGAAGLDVYEEEEGIFFQNLSEGLLQDDTLARLLSFPNVLITSHQGFLTNEALHNIAETTLANIQAFEEGRFLINEVKAGPL